MMDFDYSPVLLDSWIEEIDKFEFPGNRYLSRPLADCWRHVFRGTLRYIKYHGQDRPKDPSFLARYEIVLTTYGTVVADFNRSHKVLESIEWYRIIADEGTFTLEDEILMVNATCNIFPSTCNSKFIDETIPSCEQDTLSYSLVFDWYPNPKFFDRSRCTCVFPGCADPKRASDLSKAC